MRRGRDPPRRTGGAGLGGRDAKPGWSLSTDATELAAIIEERDIVCGAGWSATTVLLAAGQQRPAVVVLYSPPIGLDLRDVLDETRRDPSAGRNFMGALGGRTEYWNTAQQAHNFESRIIAYLSQDVVTAGQRVTCPVAVVTQRTEESSLPEGWVVIRCEPQQVPARVLAIGC